MAAYFGWLFTGLTVMMFVSLYVSIVGRLVRAKWPRIATYGALASFIAVTHIVSWPAASEVFPRFRPQLSIYVVMTFEESAQLALMNLTLFSLVCVISLALYRLTGWVHSDVDNEGVALLSGRLGRAVNWMVAALGVVSSVITIAQALQR